MIKRVVSAFVLVPIVVYLVVWANLFWVKLAFLLVGGIAYSEWLGLDSKQFNKVKSFYLANFFAFSFVFLFYPSFIVVTIFLVLTAHLLISFSNFKNSFLKNQFFFTGILYVSLYFFAVKIMQLKDGRLLLLTVFVTIWSSDTFAFFCGKSFGKIKLAKLISPNKTVEGALCGLIGGTIIGVIFGEVLKLELGTVFAVSLVANLSGIIGDLAESVPKRFFDKKDSSNIIPGHGGILDRLDSFAFAVFFSYLVVLCITLLS